MATTTRRRKTTPAPIQLEQAPVEAGAPTSEFVMMEVLRAVLTLPLEERRQALVSALEVFDAAQAGDFGAGVLVGVAPRWRTPA